MGMLSSRDVSRHIGHKKRVVVCHSVSMVVGGARD